MGARKNGALEGKTPLPSLVSLARPVLSWAVTSKRLAMSCLHGPTWYQRECFFFPESLIPGCLFKKWFDNVYGTKLIRVLSKVSCLKLGSEMNDFCLKQN